jgi:hypothetical protein
MVQCRPNCTLSKFQISFVGEPEGKRPLGIPMCRWEGNIKMDLREILMEGVDCIIWSSIGTDDEILCIR